MSDVYLDEEGNETADPELASEGGLDDESHEDDQSDSGEDDTRLSSLEAGGDAELNDAADDDEREGIRARRREERKNRKTAQREREESLRRELASRDSIINDLRSRVDQIDNRNKGSELAQLENAKKQVAQNYNFFKDQIRVATDAGNGAAVAEATEKMFLSQRTFDELNHREKLLKNHQSAPQALDPRLVNQAQSWMKRNSWYDPSAKDQDSEIVLRLDQRMSEEGWDPTTPQYWEELDTRVKKYLPHRLNRDKISNNKPRSVVTGSGREASSSNSPGVYKLSSERVKALKDAGMWDDPGQRKEAIKRFREFDKQNQE